MSLDGGFIYTARQVWPGACPAERTTVSGGEGLLSPLAYGHGKAKKNLVQC